MNKRGGAVGRFGDCVCLGCANWPCVSSRIQFTSTKLNKPNTHVTKCSVE